MIVVGPQSNEKNMKEGRHCLNWFGIENDMIVALPGGCSTYTSRPIPGAPKDGGLFSGTEAVYSIVQKPAGIPADTVAVGKAGARNAATVAARTLANSDPAIAAKVEEFKQKEYKI